MSNNFNYLNKLMLIEKLLAHIFNKILELKFQIKYFI